MTWEMSSARLSNMSFRFKQKNLQDFDYTVHAVGFGVRYRTPVGPVRVDLAYSINPPSFNGFSGTPQQLLQCNPERARSGACRIARRHGRRQPFPVLLFDRTDLLMLTAIIAVCCLLALQPARRVVLDRIAVVVGKRVDQVERHRSRSAGHRISESRAAVDQRGGQRKPPPNA